jgi:hypothetical protein
MNKKIEINEDSLNAIADEMKKAKHESIQAKNNLQSTFKIKQYRPNFFSGFEDEVAEFKTLEEFLNIEFVKNAKDIEKYKDYKSKGFFVADDEPMIFHIIYNPEKKQDEQWGLARILEGDIDKLREVFYAKYKLQNLYE